MNLSKQNKKRIDGWQQLPGVVKIADLPIYLGYVFQKEDDFKCIVVKEPRYSGKYNYTTPLVYETAEYLTRKEAIAAARRNCT